MLTVGLQHASIWYPRRGSDPQPPVVPEDDCPYQFKISTVRPYGFSVNKITHSIIKQVSISSTEKVNIQETQTSIPCLLTVHMCCACT